MPKMHKLAANPLNSCQRLYPSMIISPGSQLKTTIGRTQKGAQCPLLAPSRHHAAEFQCPLLGVKRTSDRDASMSAFDPKRTFGPEDCCRRSEICGRIGRTR